MFDFQNLKRIGSGRFRVAHIHPENNQLVVKTCKKDDKVSIRKCVQMMRDEIQAAQKFPQLFPKVFNITPDGKSMVVERANILVPSHQDFLISNYFPELQGYFIKSGAKDFMDFLHKIIEQLLIRKNQAGRREIKTYNPTKFFKNSPGKIIRRAMTNHLFVDIFEATIELDIDYFDIDWGNIGISVVDGRFMIVDASMMSGFKA